MADLKQSGISKLSIEVVRDRQTPDGLNSLLASLIPHCRRNIETACALTLWGRMQGVPRLQIVQKPFLRQNVLPHLTYRTTLDALQKAVLRAV